MTSDRRLGLRPLQDVDRTVQRALTDDAGCIEDRGPTNAAPIVVVPMTAYATTDNQGDGRTLLKALEVALRQDPDDVEALQQYVALALRAAKPHIAAQCATHWVALAPNSGVAHAMLGVALRHCGRLAEALGQLKISVELDPDLFEARINYANVLVEVRDLDAALLQYTEAIRLRPEAAPAHNNVGNLHRERRQPTLALAAYRRALQLDATHVTAWNNVGTILREFADTEGAMAAFEQALALDPGRLDIWSNLLLTLVGSDRVSAAQVAQRHAQFGQHFGSRIAPMPSSATARAATGRLRVGFVSPDFRRHAVATFFMPLLTAIDRVRIEVFCYYNSASGDATTALIQRDAEHFVPVAGMNDAQLAARIRADGIDILVDLAGHTAGNRLGLFFLKPAPLQISWLGYLGWTGVEAIRWRVSDPMADPGNDDVGPSGAVWRLPRTLWCYQPYEGSPDVSPLPARQKGHLTFGSFNQPSKLTPTMMAIWVDLLNCVPGAHLHLLASPDPARIDAIRGRFAEARIDAERLTIVERMPIRDYLASYCQIDIALDTWPYGGGTTTCDALWMGVPVVTLASHRPFARSASSILAQVELSALVAEDAAGYVERAVSLAQDLDGLAIMRAQLRERMSRSALRDARAFAGDFATMLEEMWRGVTWINA